MSYYLLKFIWRMFGLLPYRLVAWGAAVTFKIILKVTSLGATTHANLALAFPSQDTAQYADGMCYELGRLVADLLRAHKITRHWIEEHVEIPYLAEYQRLKAEHPGKGVLLVTGHLGSFELMATAIALHGHPISFITRTFKQAGVERFFKELRERNGNKVIERRGGLRGMLSLLEQGQDVAVLFDQNVTKKHAVFVPWFGKLAATTASIGIAALRLNPIVIVASMENLPGGRYRLNAERVSLDDITSNSMLNDDEKILEITRRVSDVFIERIRRYPTGWFWLHKRWKTQPAG